MLTNRECRKISRNLRHDYHMSDSCERHSYVLCDTPVVTKRTDLKSGVSLYTLQTGGWKTQLTKKSDVRSYQKMYDTQRLYFHE
jgi:hypothetical protein